MRGILRDGSDARGGGSDRGEAAGKETCLVWMKACFLPHKRLTVGTHAFHPEVDHKLCLPSATALLGGAESSPPSRLSQRVLSAVVNCDAWLRCKELTDSFDAANTPDASVRDREAAHQSVTESPLV